MEPAVETPAKESFPEKRARGLGLEGNELNELKCTASLLGTNPRAELDKLTKQGLNDEDIAKQLSNDKHSIKAYSIFILKRLLITSTARRVNYGKYLSPEVSDIVKNGNADDFKGEDLIVYLTRFLFSPPMKFEFLVRDLKISRQALVDKEKELLDRLKVA